MSRVRILAVTALVTGVFLIAGGVAVAVTRVSDPGAGSAQVVYPQETPQAPLGPPDDGNVLGDGDQGGTDEPGGPAPDDFDDGSGGDVLGDRESEGDGGGDGEDGGDPTSEASVAGTGGDSLPFTGWAAIPLLLAGATMLVVGGALRRRTGT